VRARIWPHVTPNIFHSVCVCVRACVCVCRMHANRMRIVKERQARYSPTTLSERIDMAPQATPSQSARIEEAPGVPEAQHT
jgi:hypothetical protein